MIYFLHGSDSEKSREKLNSLLDSLFNKKPEASFFKLDSDNFTESKLEELILSQGLFEQKYIVLLDNLLSEKDYHKIILDNLKEIASSANVFVLLEKVLDKKTISSIEKRADKTQLFGEAQKKKEEKRSFNIFSLTDSFGHREKKKTWVIFQKALFSGVLAEEIQNILIWQIKNLLLVKRVKNAKDAGLNPFVFKKSVSMSKNFEEQELKNLSANLLSIYSLNRKGVGELGFELEKFLLRV